MRRVFVTGYGLITAFGKSWQDNKIALEKKENAVKIMNEWDKYSDLNTRLAAPILNYAHPKSWTRKQTRSMGRVSEFSVEASSMAFDMAKLGDEIKDGRMGVASGSSTGSTDAVASMARLLLEGESDCNANTYIKMMPHTTAANIALFFGLKGRIIPTSSACTSASHAIGYSFEAIKYGLIDMMIAGGAEELCPSEAYVFDTLYATSTKNSTPNLTPCPFDKDRDGLVLGEGAGFLVLESEENVKKRGIVPIAEVVGFGSTSDGTHITQPNPNTMKEAMALALKSANLNPKDIKYINAHATATTLGDIAESKATNELFGENIAISSTKSYLGHTLGACGGIEAIFSIEMMRQNLFYPTINLKNIDEKCAKLNYLRDITNIKTDYVMSNNFAFGGVNTSLIFKKYFKG
ncbi:beta-ketoacyl-ACP synthase [Campylobacter ureolyticus]|uniref:beta-ketoacyl-ACP synthase n=1 Tax=Campylobacter ureolyticus TaxID=827 RepID=UPI0022B30998|nr:beta-ketoacyl-ACP synthase [Campylobacter ureolyticus]MCZ6168920.1 beta-ketoacyl-ACP synthase [Campylobacter ureolyticus]